jgi:hypothetical protein
MIGQYTIQSVEPSLRRYKSQVERMVANYLGVCKRADSRQYP